MTFGVSLAAAFVDAIFGVLIAWVLTRYGFPGTPFDAMVDLPFALPTAVAGIALATLYAPNGVFGAMLEKVGLRVAFTPGAFSSRSFLSACRSSCARCSRSFEELEVELEEASATLGASRAKPLRRVILPQIAPAALTGMALAFARGVGEYGSVIFIAGNMRLCLGDRAAAHHREAGGIRLRRRHRHRRHHAGSRFRDAVRHQPRPGLEPQEAGHV